MLRRVKETPYEVFRFDLRTFLVGASCFLVGAACTLALGSAELASVFVQNPEFLKEVVAHDAAVLAMGIGTPGGAVALMGRAHLAKTGQLDRARQVLGNAKRLGDIWNPPERGKAGLSG